MAPDECLKCKALLPDEELGELYCASCRIRLARPQE